MRHLILLSALLLAACAPAATVRAYGGTDLCVFNETVGYGRLLVRAGQASMRIESHQYDCARLQGSGYLLITGETIGGGLNGRLKVEDRIILDGGCWTWTVRDNVLGSLGRCLAGVR
jgi:hypothetical protein